MEWWTLFILFVPAIYPTNGKSIFVSKRHGVDKQPCGSTPACRTLESALLNETSSTLEIYLDGGEVEQLTYAMPTEYTLSGNITFKRSSNGKQKPILHNIKLFKINRKSVVHLYFKDVIFRNCTDVLFRSVYSSVLFHFDHCEMHCTMFQFQVGLIKKNSKPTTPVSNTTTTANTTTTTRTTSTTTPTSNTTTLETVKATINISNSIFCHCRIKINKFPMNDKSVQFNAINTLFTNHRTNHVVISAVKTTTTMYLRNCTFMNITAGRLIYSYSKEFQFIKSTVTENVITGVPGVRSRQRDFAAICIFKGLVVISNSTFSNNTLKFNLLYFDNVTKVQIISSSFMNHFYESFGALMFVLSSSLTVTKTEISNNVHRKFTLGLFYLKMCRVTIISSVLKNNYNRRFLNGRNSQLTLRHIFMNNNTMEYGIGVSGSLDVSQSSFISNRITTSFFDFYHGSNVIINQCIFSGNSGLSAYSVVIRIMNIPVFYIESSIFKDNTLGKLIKATGGQIGVRNCSITNNNSTENRLTYGYSIVYLLSIIRGNLSVDSSSFISNHAHKLLYIIRGKAILIDSILYKNYIVDNGIQLISSNLSITRSKIISNIFRNSFGHSIPHYLYYFTKRLYFKTQYMDFRNTIVQNNTYRNLISGAFTFNFTNVLIEKNKAASADIVDEGNKSLLAPISLVNVTVVRQAELHALENENIFDIDSTRTHLTMYNVSLELVNHQMKAFELKYNKTHVNSIQNFTVTCPYGYNVKKEIYKVGSSNILTVKCVSCRTTTYAMEGGKVQFNSSAFETKIIPVKCLSCSVGGLCNHGVIASRGNMYGELQKDNSVRFTSCPEGYCCQKNCVTYKACRANRTGILCGKCNREYQVDFFTVNCIKKGQYRNSGIFWTAFFTSPLGFVVILMYLDVFVIKMKHFYELTRLRCKPENKKKEMEEMTAIHSSQEQQDNDCSQEECIPVKEEQTYTFSGLFNILTSYFQIKNLLAVEDLSTSTPIFSKVVSTVFDPDFLQLGLSVRPAIVINTVQKLTIKRLLFNMLMPIYVILITLCYYIIHQSSQNNYRIRNALKQEVHSPSLIRNFNYRFIHRLSITYVKILLFVYKNLAIFCLTMLYCIPIQNTSVLFIQGDVQCFTYWQYIVMAFFGLWILPFPFCLKKAYQMFIQRKLRTRELILCLTIPMLLPFFYIHRTYIRPRRRVERNDMHHIIFEQMFSESYRLKEGSEDEYIFYEHWRLLQRLTLAFIVTFNNNPLKRIVYLIPCISTFAIFYLIKRPYKPEFELLHSMEIISIVGFFILLLKNNFNSFFVVYSIPIREGEIPGLVVFFTCLEWIYNPLTYLLMYFIFRPAYNKIKMFLKSKKK